MSRRLFLPVVALVVAATCATPVATQAQAVDPATAYERQQRRQELRQQLQAERHRWRADGHGGADAPMRGEMHRGVPMTPPVPLGAMPPASATMPPHPGPDGRGGRLSPEERRALREALRDHRP